MEARKEFMFGMIEKSHGSKGLLGISLAFLLLSVTFLGLPLARADGYWLFGWEYRKTLSLEGAAGAGANYVVFVVGRQTEGTDGSLALSGGHNGVTAFELFFGWRCQPDFDDVRFVGSDGTLLDIFVDNENASYCLWAVEVAGNCSVDQTIYCFFGNADAAEVSDAAATFRRVISSGVVLALPMNEGSGATCEDYSGNNNDGAITDCDWVTTGQFGNALQFVSADATNKVTVADSASLDLTNSMSFAVWFKPATINVDGCLMSKQGTNTFSGAYQLRVVNTNKVRFDGYPGAAKYQSVNNAVFSVAGVPHHVAVTYNGVAAIMFVDGASVASGGDIANQGAVETTLEALLIGRREDNGSPIWLNGVVSGLCIFNSILSVDEVADLYAYYPQCSSANLGSLYLRSFVNPEPQPAGAVTELTEAEVASNYALLAGVLGLCGCLLVAGVVVSRRKQ